jgi:hypothetical protein
MGLADTLRCALGRHEHVIVRRRGGLALECLRCLRRTQGWDLGPAQPEEPSMKVTRFWDDDRRAWRAGYSLEFTGPHAEVSLIDDAPVHPRFHAPPDLVTAGVDSGRRWTSRPEDEDDAAVA